jgi:YegS/Rv2252/BmrU family lipid kinase
MRLLLIVNAHARRGHEALDAALDVFARHGMTIREERVARGPESAGVIERYAGEVDAIVLAGGDGTVHAAAPALLRTELPLGILPLGTANDLARAIGLPLDLTQAAEVIAAGNTRRIDVGEVNGQPFFNVAHIGLGAALAGGLTATMKRRFGPLAYPMAAVRALGGLRPFRGEIVAGEERAALRTVGITVGNGRFFGGSGLVAEDAQIDDGLLHLFAISTKNPFRLALILLQVTRGRQGRSKWVHTMVAPAFEVTTVRPMAVRADGKMMTETPALFRVRSGALSVFAPAKN